MQHTRYAHLLATPTEKPVQEMQAAQCIVNDLLWRRVFQQHSLDDWHLTPMVLRHGPSTLLTRTSSHSSYEIHSWIQLLKLTWCNLTVKDGNAYSYIQIKVFWSTPKLTRYTPFLSHSSPFPFLGSTEYCSGLVMLRRSSNIITFKCLLSHT